MNEIREVARAIIVDDEGRVLLGKRAGGTDAGKWALVGGKPDDGETPEQAVVREVLEETGLFFEPSFYLEEINKETDPENPWRSFFFYGKVAGVILLRVAEIAEVVYVSEDDLEGLEIAFNNERVLREFFARDNA